jgi:hypothetical protein
MDESFSRVGLLYGMAFVLAVGKACTLLIWRTLPKPRPPLRQELLEAWRHRGTHVRARGKAAVVLKVCHLLPMKPQLTEGGTSAPLDRSHQPPLRLQARP